MEAVVVVAVAVLAAVAAVVAVVAVEQSNHIRHNLVPSFMGSGLWEGNLDPEF